MPEASRFVLPVAQARDEITDGSNQTFVRFALPACRLGTR